METLHKLYKPSLALLTDLYQITMAYGYWKVGIGDREAVFHLLFRKHPFGGGYAIACGLHEAIEFLQSLRFDESDTQYLGTLKGNDNKPLFEPAFLDFLRQMKFMLDVDAIPEGTAVFANEPLLRVRGPILQAQLVETALLNLINFPTLIATKASRICQAAGDDPVVEFGLRRSQGIDGGIAASRAAYVGGCTGTSNLLAGKLYGIPVGGTHAHSWVMCFSDEIDAFDAYAAALPNNCIFLVDTYNTLQGVRHAVKIGKKLRSHGHEMIGVRLDSGDLAYLSIEARKILDANGFSNAKILASNDLDENIISSLKDQHARINMWGVGTRLATAFDQPALGGIYKLGAIKDEANKWQYKLKLSEQTAKISTPGILQVRRFSDASGFVADAIYNESELPAGDIMIIDPGDMTRRKLLPASLKHEDLLTPIYRAGQLVYSPPPIDAVRQRTQSQLSLLHAGIKRFVNPHQYPVGLERNLHELRTELILKARGNDRTEC
jgi:nicotinate phosphoribosyltransferase